jgi:acyl carrier protein
MEADHAIFRMLFVVVGEKGREPAGPGIAERGSVSIGNGVENEADVDHDIGELRSREEIQRFMQNILAEEMNVPADSLPSNESLIHLGVDSIAALKLCSALEARIGKTLSVAELLCGSSIDDLAEKIVITKNV